MQGPRRLEVVDDRLLAHAVGQCPHHAADLVDHFGVIDPQHHVGPRVPGLELQRPVQAVANLAAEPLGERLHHRQMLAVAHQHRKPDYWKNRLG